MRQCLAIILVVFSLLTVSTEGFAGQLANRQEPQIKVGLAVKQKEVVVSAERAFSLEETMTGRVIQTFEPKEKVRISLEGAGIAVNGVKDPHTSLSLRLLTSSHRAQENTFIVNGKRYRGSIEVIRQTGKSGLTVINTLPLESYLYGVVPKEISPSWHLEAVKAQAVAARSYAFTGSGKHQDDGFDVCTTVHCQVYGGFDSETARSNQAVDETRGMMVTYRGTVATTFFHASSGGYTENSETVWSSPNPYLRGVIDYDAESPHYNWERRVSLEKLSQMLHANNCTVGQVTAIRLSPLTEQPMRIADRGVSGRVKMLTIEGTNGRVQLTGAKFSALLGLPSTLFAISMPDDAVTAYSFRKPADRRVQSAELVITGRGWGHGIGLSQWGAKAMAEKAAPNNSEQYKKILTHYYTGTTIEKWY